jgi:hypothetical protein
MVYAYSKPTIRLVILSAATEDFDNCFECPTQVKYYNMLQV